MTLIVSKGSTLYADYNTTIGEQRCGRINKIVKVNNKLMFGLAGEVHYLAVLSSFFRQHELVIRPETKEADVYDYFNSNEFSDALSGLRDGSFQIIVLVKIKNNQVLRFTVDMSEDKEAGVHDMAVIFSREEKNNDTIICVGSGEPIALMFINAGFTDVDDLFLYVSRNDHKISREYLKVTL